MPHRPEQIDTASLERWLGKAKRIQWDYKNVIKRKGRLERLPQDHSRWEGKLAALYKRHEALVAEMRRRGFRHHSDLDPRLATGSDLQEAFVDPLDRQVEILRAKECGCYERTP